MHESQTPGAPSAMPDEYDRLSGLLHGLTGVTKTKATSITAIPLLGVGGSTQYIVQTYRQRDEMADPDEKARPSRDLCFLIIAGPNGYHRHVLPNEVIDAIIRQRESLTTMTRRKIGKANAPRLRQLAKDRIARGELPGFLRHKRKKK